MTKEQREEIERQQKERTEKFENILTMLNSKEFKELENLFFIELHKVKNTLVYQNIKSPYLLDQVIPYEIGVALGIKCRLATYKMLRYRLQRGKENSRWLMILQGFCKGFDWTKKITILKEKLEKTTISK